MHNSHFIQFTRSSSLLKSGKTMRISVTGAIIAWSWCDVNTRELEDIGRQLTLSPGRAGYRTEAKDTGDAWRIGKIFVQNIEKFWKGAQRTGILDFDWYRFWLPKVELDAMTSSGVVSGPPIEGPWSSILSGFLFASNEACQMKFSSRRLLHRASDIWQIDFPRGGLTTRSARSGDRCNSIVKSNKSHNAQQNFE